MLCSCDDAFEQISYLLPALSNKYLSSSSLIRESISHFKVGYSNIMAQLPKI